MGLLAHKSPLRVRFANNRATPRKDGVNYARIMDLTRVQEEIQQDGYKHERFWCKQKTN